MISGLEVIVHQTNDVPFALELVADHSTLEGQTYQGFPLSYNNSFFRINNGYNGLDGRVVRSIPPEFRWAKYINGCGKSWVGFGTIPAGEEQYLNMKYSNEMGSAWDRNYFLVATRKNSQKYLLENFFKTFQTRDMALWLSHGQFSISNKVSLFIAIKSKIPDSLSNEMRAYDENMVKWRNDPKVNDLFVKLRNAGRSYNSLQVVNKKPTGELVYWLNVYNTRVNISGLYDQFEMDAWVNNQGPIVKGAAPLVRPQPATAVPAVAATPATTVTTTATRTTPGLLWGTITNNAVVRFVNDPRR
jgi:hypothetical protein